MAFLEKLPYRVGIVGGISAGFVTIPLCFHLPSVQWFNEVRNPAPPASLLPFLSRPPRNSSNAAAPGTGTKGRLIDACRADRPT